MTPKKPGVYVITNMITGERYVGSSKDMNHRRIEHFSISRWYLCPHNRLYKDMKKFGTNNFEFTCIVVVEDIDKLREEEQKAIDTLKPEYNKLRAIR